MGLFSTLFGSRKKEREEAARLGITALEVTRDLPQFSLGNKTVTLEPDRCIRYSIPRRARGGPIWSLVQRTKEVGATFPNGYVLTTSAVLHSALEEQLRKIAEEYAEELFEFEGTANDVAVYWEEWGGPERVRSLHAHLDRLASF